MKKTILAAALVGLMMTAQAAYYAPSWTVNQTIPDGNPVGWMNTQTVDWDGQFGNAGTWTITDLKVTFTINNGYNGDLYAYLAHGDSLVVLLNRVGSGSGAEPQYTYGFSTSGFGSVTLWDGATTSIHDVVNPAGGTYQPDGSTLASNSGVDFLGMNPHGAWTIFFADLSGGDPTQSYLVSWGLEINAVPEPVNVALGIFGAVGAGVWGVRRWRSRAKAS